MLILVFMFALIRHLQGAPTTTPPSIPNCDPTDFFIRDDPTNSHFGTRGVSDIVVSCIATIFACTWTAIHPNIPGPCDSDWEIFKRQITTMVYALLAPEMVTAWALRQYLAARWIANDYNRDIAKIQPQKQSLVENLTHVVSRRFHRKPLPQPLKKGGVIPWTITHGFFVQMGGLMLCEDGKPVQTLGGYGMWGNVIDLIKNGLLDAPKITEAEIQDRSKGDALSKTIVVLQTTWFIAQCIVRWSSNLPVTELEIVTLGFAMLNALTYGLWWSKPQSVGLPVYLERKSSIQKTSKGQEPSNSQIQGEGECAGTEADPQNTRDLEHTVYPARLSAVPVPLLLSGQSGKQEPLVERSYLFSMLQEDMETDRWNLFWKVPYRLFRAALRPVSKLLHFSRTWVSQGDLRVTMFNSAQANDGVVFMISALIASVFGLIHLIPAWFLDFPSHTEMILWRVSAAVITGQPIILGLWTQLKGNSDLGSYSMQADRSPLAFISLIGVPFYILARIVLLTLAFVSLRALPPPTFVDINWISFIPHL